MAEYSFAEVGLIDRPIAITLPNIELGYNAKNVTTIDRGGK
jgi:hypothetical protein